MFEERLVTKKVRKIYKEMTGAIEERICGIDIKSWLKAALGDAMDIEITEVIHAKEFERTLERTDYRNGFYERSIDTVYGWIENLRVPRLRTKAYNPSVFEKYERREQSLNKLIMECYWRGISTRDVDHILMALSGIHVSATTVSEITKKWQYEVSRWHTRQLTDEYIYLMFDGVWIKNRSLGKTKRLVLVVYGVKINGEREIIDYELSQTEKQEHWERFLTRLYHRGLQGKQLKLIVTDGCHGLWNAIEMVYPGIAHQLCWAHKMRNILRYIKQKDIENVRHGLSKIFSDDLMTKEEGLRIIACWKKKWRHLYPRAVRSLETHEDKLFNYLSCPHEHHKALRTSNHIERQFKELRRRMRSAEILPNKDAAERMLYALIMRRNEKLKHYPLLINNNFTQNYLH